MIKRDNDKTIRQIVKEFNQKSKEYRVWICPMGMTIKRVISNETMISESFWQWPINRIELIDYLNIHLSEG